MEELENYISHTLGTDLHIRHLTNELLGNLPVYVNETYTFYEAELWGYSIILVKPRYMEDFSVLQSERQMGLIRSSLNCKVVLVLPKLAAYNRKRLIEKRINFIVPGKQLFLPELLMDLKEDFLSDKKEPTDKLLPSAQFLLIYHLLHDRKVNEWNMSKNSFKDIAQKTGYTAMAITKAVENLKHHELISVKGQKEKAIHFIYERHEMWHEAMRRKLLINPVLKKVFVDEKPNLFLLQSNSSALSEYTEMNPSKQKFYAIDKNKYYQLQKNDELVNENKTEGRYCLEVWKYDPLTLVGDLPNDNPVVDPLSLYLSLQHNTDERIEMALDHLINQTIW